MSAVVAIECDETARTLVIVLDDGQRHEIAADAIEARDLRPGLVLSDDQARALEDAAQRKIIARATFALLDRRARCRADLRQRLIAKGFTAALVDAVLDRFVTEGVLDDRAYAREWARTRIEHKGVGRRWLVAGLCRQGIDAAVARDAVDLAFEQTGGDELEAARRALRRRRLDLEVEAQRRRGMRFLMARGFAQGVCLQALRAERAAARKGDEPDFDGETDGAHA